MTKHTTAELKRQMEAAASRRAAATTAHEDATRAYKFALVAERLAAHAANGVYPGDKVVLCVKQHTSERYNRTVVGFLGVDAPYYGYRPEDVLSRLKRDGTPSKARAIFDSGTLEPFEGSPEQRAEGKS